jgi:hypothetical protein
MPEFSFFHNLVEFTWTMTTLAGFIGLCVGYFIEATSGKKEDAYPWIRNGSLLFLFGMLVLRFLTHHFLPYP